MNTRHGLVIGKFYPPHAGHHHLIRVAAARCEQLTVLLMAASVETLPLARRVDWLREVHADNPRVTVTGIVDDHPVDFDDDALWRAHVALMREGASRVTPAPVDVVFTSEHYGDELARRLGARHELVDLRRHAHPISGTAVRADPVAHWTALAPCVRAYLALRVILVGAESTGKTTLARALAEALRARDATHGSAYAATQWVPEVGRELTSEKLALLGANADVAALRWETPDFIEVARRQAQREEQTARIGGPVLICDTDAFATGIWHERYVGVRSAEVERLGVAPHAHLYLLTHPDDVPFIDDGMRDGEHLRHWMTERFVERLSKTDRQWQWLRGSRDARLADTLTAIDLALLRVFRFAAPLG